MRFRVELAGISIGMTDAIVQERRSAASSRASRTRPIASSLEKGATRSGVSSPAPDRPRGGGGGGRGWWRGCFNARMDWGVCTAAGVPVYGVRVLVFDCARADGSPTVVLYVGESLAGMPAEIRSAGSGPRPWSRRALKPRSDLVAARFARSAGRAQWLDPGVGRTHHSRLRLRFRHASFPVHGDRPVGARALARSAVDSSDKAQCPGPDHEIVPRLQLLRRLAPRRLRFHPGGQP